MQESGEDQALWQQSFLIIAKTMLHSTITLSLFYYLFIFKLFYFKPSGFCLLFIT